MARYFGLLNAQHANFLPMPDEIAFSDLRARVIRLEHAVEFLLAQTGLTYQDIPSSISAYPEVAELKRQGKMIDAIKAYRLKTNAGLAEAKQFVDNLQI